MRVVLALVAAALLAGCGLAGFDAVAVQARRTCIDNGHAIGTAGFDACFHRVYSASRGVPLLSDQPR